MLPIFYIKKGFLHFGEKEILKNVEIYIHPTDRVCLIGRNGSGKSSLIKVILGEYELDDGEIYKMPGLTLGHLKQEINTNNKFTIYEYILTQFQNQEPARYKADMILENLKLDGDLILSNCSGGQIRRASLAKALVLEPQILLLDEPTNHLDIDTIEWLEEYIKSYPGAVICISHDRALLSSVTNKVWWIDRGILRKSNKGFKFFEEWQETILEEEENYFKKLGKKLTVETQWLHGGVTARRKRNQRRLGDLKNLRLQLKDSGNALGDAKKKLNINLSANIKQTNFIVEVEHISFAYENKFIINDFSFRVQKGEKIGIIGPNGSGKSTFIKLLVGAQKANSGLVRYGAGLDISYIDQYRLDINLNDTLKETLCPQGGDQIFLHNQIIHVSAYLKQFMFDPKSLYDKVSTLSGGEVNRLLLAKILINPGNLLILDEPTNDLDMDSLEILLEILSDFPGTVIIVSHDRDFLERLVSRTLIFTQGKIIDQFGGYEDYKKFIAPAKLVTLSKIASKKIVDTLPPTNKKNKKLSYNQQRLLTSIPIEINKLETYIAQLEKQLGDNNLFISNADKFTKLSLELVEAKAKIDNLMEEWLNIEDLI